MSRRLLFFVLLAACIVLAAAVSQRHTWRLDLTAQRMHSLSPAAQAALGALSNPLEITAFVPDFAVQRTEIERLLAPYLAHPGRPALRFVDPVAQPALAREMGVARHGELQLVSGRRREVVLWQKILQKKGLAALLSREVPAEYKAPGTWMHDALTWRDRWQSRLLRSTAWSPWY